MRGERLDERAGIDFRLQDVPVSNCKDSETNGARLAFLSASTKATMSSAKISSPPAEIVGVSSLQRAHSRSQQSFDAPHETRVRPLPGKASLYQLKSLTTRGFGLTYGEPNNSMPRRSSSGFSIASMASTKAGGGESQEGRPVNQSSGFQLGPFLQSASLAGRGWVAPTYERAPWNTPPSSMMSVT